ncbi:1,2-phenylacetyl-CoA epoxidase subunit PaaD [Arthrobacter sp. PAMC 25486]|uniref:1,2-phenylacetyl-CoA epoxidase subunit PaaD n=1 Tax=Arthrobacter sp. PAMC 25486 TaxID=1494608 RepID=UPI0020A63C8B|nr:1,2-phenylacetyl-CoA epoxidase subunit PaaD [Arthrobacter sp. PAMC 25486]
MAELRSQAAGTETAATKSQQTAWDIAAAVPDPELPVLTIEDLGILRKVEVAGLNVRVTITPTYSGCPAMDTIRNDLRAAFAQQGWPDPEIVTVLSPAWTTDWMSAAGRAKLEAFRIAPPSGQSQVGGHSGPVRLALQVKCPHCQSLNTRELARFGSTSCKALYVCGECREPFDYFKVL